MSTGCESEEVELRHAAELNTRQIPESLDNALVLVVDNERATTRPPSTVPPLALTRSDRAGRPTLLDVPVGIVSLKERNSLLGLLDGLCFVSNNERNFVDLLDAVATGKEERGEGGSSESGRNSVAALVDAGLDVPLAPDLGRSEHASATAHVTEGTLAGTMGTRASDTGNTSDGTSCTPGFSGGLVTSLLRNSIWLPLVLIERL